MNNEAKTWVLDVQEDPETGDAIIQLNDDILASTGWQEGDELLWTNLGNGSWSLTKKEKDA